MSTTFFNNTKASEGTVSFTKSLGDDSQAPSPFFRFEEVPSDIIRLLMDRISLSETACLALTTKKCHAYFDQIGILKTTNRRPVARRHLLEKLRHEVSIDLVCCGMCKSLHRPSSLHDFFRDTSEQLRQCHVREYKEKSSDYFSPGFGFNQIHIAGEYNYRRLYPKRDKYLARLATQWCQQNTRFVSALQTKWLPNPWRPEEGGTAAIRKQEWWIMPQGLPSSSNPGGTIVNRKANFAKLCSLICAHEPASKEHWQKTSMNEIFDFYRSKGRSRPAWATTISKTNGKKWQYSSMDRCAHCNAEYRTDFGDIDGNRTAIVVTKWMSLGNGAIRRGRDWQNHWQSVENGAPGHQNRFILECNLNESLFHEYEGTDMLEEYIPEWSPELERVWLNREAFMSVK